MTGLHPSKESNVTKDKVNICWGPDPGRKKNVIKYILGTTCEF